MAVRAKRIDLFEKVFPERRTCSCQEQTWKGSSPEDTSTPSLCCYEESSTYSQETKSTSPDMCEKSLPKSQFNVQATKALTDSGVQTNEIIDVCEDIDVYDHLHVILDVVKNDVECNEENILTSNDSEDTDKLVKLRNNDYNTIEDDLKIVLALSGYPKSKIRLQDLEKFNRSINDIIDMQMKACLLKKSPTFLDCYINRGAIVCIFTDIDSKQWVIRVSSGIQERMNCTLMLLSTATTRLCLAKMKIPKTCWPASYRDAFKLLQYFNPKLKTDMWKVYALKNVDDIEHSSFVIDNDSYEIIRSSTFKNVIDYSQIDFNVSEFIEIYNKSLSFDEDISSVASRVKLLNELRSDDSALTLCMKKSNKRNTRSDEIESDVTIQGKHTDVNEKANVSEIESNVEEVESQNLCINDAKETISEPEVARRSDDQGTIEVDFINTIKLEKTVQVYDQESQTADSSLNASNASSTFNIDIKRGIAYYRRTNYLHIANELKTAIVLEGYPKDKLEGSYIQQMNRVFKEHVQKEVKLHRFSDVIIPKFHDVYLSNGAAIHICDSIESKEYLIGFLPKLMKATGLKLTYRDIKDLVRFTRVVMKLPKEISRVESKAILFSLQLSHPRLKADNWKRYSDVVGRVTRQFGVDPESLEVIKSFDFNPLYEGHRIDFRIIDRQKPNTGIENKRPAEDNIAEKIQALELRAKLLKIMYCTSEPSMSESSLLNIRKTHYRDLIPDDFKLYIGPAKYPDIYINETSFYIVKETLEDLVMNNWSAEEELLPKIYDMYLRDGVIFVICKDIASRVWIESNIGRLSCRLQYALKATEYRGAVGIVTMVVHTKKSYEEVTTILQRQNPRLRTKYWRKINIIESDKSQIVLQIDSLSAQVITSSNFNGCVDNQMVEFKLGYLQTMLKSRRTLETFNNWENFINVSEIETQGTNNNNSKYKEAEEKCTSKDIDQSKIYKGNDNYNTMKAMGLITDNEYCKVDLIIPTNILPVTKGCLDIILNLLNKKNPGLNTNVWKVESYDNSGHFSLLVDKSSASVIRSNEFDPSLGGEELLFKY